MRSSKFKYLLITFGLLLGLCLPVAALAGRAAAVDVLPPGCGADICKDNQTKATDENSPIWGKDGIITAVINIFALVIGIITIVTVIISGMMLIFSGGEPTKTATATRALTYGLAGLAVAAIARLLVVFVLNKIGG